VSDYQTIRYQRDGDIATLTLARPGKRNAQNPLMWQELARLGAGLLPDQTLRCLVVTGEGPAFSAGIDLVEGMAWLAAVAGRPRDEHTLAAGRAAAAATPTARACSWPWRAISASSPKAPRWA
jgi:enoyl-CoA hydratase/carnithine racemase